MDKPKIGIELIKEQFQLANEHMIAAQLIMNDIYLFLGTIGKKDDGNKQINKEL